MGFLKCLKPNEVPQDESLDKLLIRIKKCSSWPFRFKKYIFLSKHFVERITTYLSEGNEEVKYAESIEILAEGIRLMPIRVVLRTSFCSSLDSRLLKLSELSDQVETLKKTIDSIEAWPSKYIDVFIACEHFQNRLQEAMRLQESEMGVYLVPDLNAMWNDPYTCNKYDNIDWILEHIVDEELLDGYIYQYKFKRHHITNFNKDPEAIETLQKSIKKRKLEFPSLTSNNNWDIKRSGLIVEYIPNGLVPRRVEVTGVHFLKELLSSDDEQLLKNKKKLTIVISSFLGLSMMRRAMKLSFTVYNVEYTLYFIELFIRVANYVASCWSKNDEFIDWFKHLQNNFEYLFTVVNMIKMSELTVPSTINLHVITRIVKVLSRMMFYRKFLKLADNIYFENCLNLMIKLTWQLHNDEKVDKPFFITNETTVQYKSMVVELPDQPKIKVNNISQNWLKRLHDFDIEAVKKEPCLMCGGTYDGDTDLVLFLSCDDVICFKCAHHWFRVCDVKKKVYHCMYCYAEVEEYIQVSKVDQIKKILNLPILIEQNEEKS